MLGIAAHVYADTFSHYGFSGVSSRGNKVYNSSFRLNEEVEGLDETITASASRITPPSGRCGEIALGRKSWLFCGSDRGGERAAAMYTLIGTAKLNDVDPQAWLADVLARIAEKPQTRLPRASPLALEDRPATGLGRIACGLRRRLTSA